MIKKTALITGASSGIGFELAKCFAQGHDDLIIVARSVAKLEALAAELKAKHHTKVTVIGCDLSTPDSPAKLYAEIQTRELDVHTLVNNAGIGSFGPFGEMTADQLQQILAINISALSTLTHLFLPAMQARGSGQILNVASTASFQPGPLMAVYYASKAYVLSFSEALANELASEGITVTALCPGPTATDFQNKANVQNSQLFKKMQVMDAATVAQAGYAGLQKGKAVVIPGLVNKLLIQSNRITPRSWTRKIVRKIQETRH